MDDNDIDLVRRYAVGREEAAFAALVARYVDLVYSAAMRQVRDPGLAQEVTQAVFIVLARKADSLDRNTILSAWLWRTTRFAAADVLKAKWRREKREREAHRQFVERDAGTDAWSGLAPQLDAALAHLGEKERAAIVLRFFEGRSFDSVGRALGTSGEAAKMRVSRAVGKLRKHLCREGVVMPAAAIPAALAALAAEAGRAAPEGIFASVGVVTVGSKGVAGGTAALALATTTLQAMAWSPVKGVVAAGLALLVTATAVTTAVTTANGRDPDAWESVPADEAMLDRVPPQMRIVPTKFPTRGGIASSRGPNADPKMLGINVSLPELIHQAYGVNPARTVLPANLPAEHYDFIANLRRGSAEALQALIARQFGLVGARVTQDRDVFRLVIKDPHAPNLAPSDPNAVAHSSFGGNSYEARGYPITHFIAYLETELGQPVVDTTNLAGRLNIDFRGDWTSPATVEQLGQPLRDQLGLELVPVRQPVEILVISRKQ